MTIPPFSSSALTDEQMALRIRHSSSGSTKNTEKSNNMLQQQFQHYSSKVPISPSGISRMDVLSERIYDFHQNTEQNQMQLNRKLLLRDQLYYAISPIFPCNLIKRCFLYYFLVCGLYIVGSSLNGFGTLHSDLDLCLMITNRDIDQKSDAVVVLSSVMRTLKTTMLVVDQQLIPAKVPILRIKCGGAFSDIVVDLNVNNSVAIRNTHLLCYYSAFDWRVRLIVMVVKEWAKRRGINNASQSSFTSYSLVLMVIHYLQCGANPPVLPSLQMLYPKRFSEKIDVRLLNVSQPLDPLPSQVWNFDQRLSLGELLLGFLHYYAYEFNFETDAISIRMGRKMDRAQAMQNQSPFNTLSQWHCICIEEPFTLSNAAHSIYDERIFQEIKKTFADSYHDLDKQRDLDRFLSELPLQIQITPPPAIPVVNASPPINVNGCESIKTETTEVENNSSDKLQQGELSP
uniref:PAP-associated domain-containing protein n=1 Tax=Meloidogyne hapla TaxID=6305 RepID=A0A1I8BIT9_MELHA